MSIDEAQQPLQALGTAESQDPAPCGSTRLLSSLRLPCSAAIAALLLLLVGAGSGRRARARPAGEAADVVSLAAAPWAQHPKYAMVHGDIETLWQRPHGEVKGLFFAAHGCCHQGPDYFSEVEPDGWRFAACGETIGGSCLGLPEEVRFRHAVLDRGYVFVAVSGGSGRGSCWYGSDPPRVKAAIAHVVAQEGLEGLPVFATGSSSGGALMAPMASEGGVPNVKCVVPMVSLTSPTELRVPALFVYMSRDGGTAYMVADAFGDFEAEKIRAGKIEARPVALTAEFLGRCLEKELAREVIDALKEAGVIDEDSFLKEDARSRAWVEPTRKAIEGRSHDSLVADRSCLSELMNVAWSFHEFTGEYSEEMLDFCEGKWQGTFKG